MRRREVLKLLAAGLSLPWSCTVSEARTSSSSSGRMPVIFLAHGSPFLLDDAGWVAELRRWALALPRPRSVLMISAHWEEKVPTVMTSTTPPMLYDYYGFPPKSYEIQWPAPGAPQLAARVQELLGKAGIETSTDGARGFDDGTFVPLKLTYPDAEIPTIQLSLKAGLDPAEHLAIGRALAA